MSTDDPPDSPDGASPPDQAPLRSRPAVSVFGSVADVWVPTLLVIAVVGFFAALAHAPVVALAAVGVFVLGLIPQAKMKRADLLMELQERFSVMAGDKEALDGSVRVFGERRRKSAYAFYLRFWNLQLLEFGLWRYGMLPSDTFAHWIVRRLLSFRPGNPERYWDLAPLDGWHLVREEFVGTDFRQFIEAAILIGKEVDRTYPGSGAMDAMGRRTEVSIAHYDSLHRRIERLLVRVGGGELGSTFIIRWFNARRPSIRVRSPERLAQETTKRLLRERPWWRFFSPLLFALLVPIAILLGLELRESWPDIRDRTSRAVPWLLGFGGEDPDPAPPPVTVVLDPESGPASHFVVRFPTEGACTPGGDPSRWRGATMTSTTRGWVEDIGRDLAACHTDDQPVRVAVAGFASSSTFRDLRDCGPGILSSDAANLALAHARGAGVADLLREHLPAGGVDHLTWRSMAEMEAERAFVDRTIGSLYDRSRGGLNRRAEVRILEAGACAAD